jgi:Ca2+:H+ antiporter
MMCLVIPAAFFAGVNKIQAQQITDVITDDFRNTMLLFSRGMVSGCIQHRTTRIDL